MITAHTRETVREENEEWRISGGGGSIKSATRTTYYYFEVTANVGGGEGGKFAVVPSIANWYVPFSPALSS